MSTPLAGPDRSQVATTEWRIGRKPRKFRDKFESMPCPETPFYNNDLWLAEGVGFEPTVRSRAQRFSRPPRSTTPAPLREVIRLSRTARRVRPGPAGAKLPQGPEARKQHPSGLHHLI